MPVCEVYERTTTRFVIVEPRDPFNVVDRCPVNETGHQPIVSCGEIVCAHCARIIWR